MKTIIALSLVALFAATATLASERLDASCKGRIVYDLGQKGLDVRSIRLTGVDRNDCQDDLCNPDVLQLLVTARNPQGQLVTLAVEASTPEEGLENGCRVYSSRIVKTAR